MNDANYLVHEKTYQELRAQGFQGWGGDSLLPFSQNYDVTGVDISPTAIEWAKEKIPTGTFLSQSVVDLSNFKNESFDAILDSACFHCIIGEDRKTVLSEIYRVLKPGGFFLVNHMVNDPRELPSGTTFDPENRTQKKDGLPYRTMPTGAGLLQNLEETGFKVVKHEIRQNPWWGPPF